jgi:hypothetical protein
MTARNPPVFPRVSSASHFRLPFLCVAGYFIAGCTASLGPGYTVDKQEIRVQFVPVREPIIHIEGVYQLRNTGNQSLRSLEVRLPGRRRFNFQNFRAEWDAASLTPSVSPDDDRNVLLSFPQSWRVCDRRALHLSFDFRPAAGESALTFTPDAFFLSAQGWSPELLPARGFLATGGVPPAKWNLVVRVPDGFLVHMSGRAPKTSRSAGTQTLTALQQPTSAYPFVVAGRYTAATKLNAGAISMNLWTRSPRPSDDLNRISDALVRTIQVYNSMFGAPAQFRQFWVVQCPAAPGCFSQSASAYGALISTQEQETSAEMASLDTVMVDFSAGVLRIAHAAAPSLASGWLGYDQNPGFFEQDRPLSALPAFAAAHARESVEGPQVRVQIIRRALADIPPRSTSAPNKSEDPAIIRAKSLLFFYGLQDFYGPTVFNKAVTHMLSARRGGGFDLDDLISAFEQETQQNAAEFVRRWMKRPGVPQEFRARYENSVNADILPLPDANTKETHP